MKTLLSLKSILPLALLFCATSISANKIISVADFGLKPDSRINAVPFVQKAIDACKRIPAPLLSFPKEDTISGHNMLLKRNITRQIHMM